MTIVKRAARFLFLLILFACAPKGAGPVAVPEGMRFSVSLPAAKRVSIAGSFNRWDTARDRLAGPDAEGVWSITLPLRPGRYEYRFFMNNTEWVLDPAAPAVDDGIGDRNSLVIVPAATAP